jgi:hypothetical protein
MPSGTPRDPGKRPVGGSRPEAIRGHVRVIAAALAGWFALVWFGVVVLGDNAGRSALMAGIVVALAVAGWWFAGPRRT